MGQLSRDATRQSRQLCVTADKWVAAPATPQQLTYAAGGTSILVLSGRRVNCSPHCIFWYMYLQHTLHKWRHHATSSVWAPPSNWIINGLYSVHLWVLIFDACGSNPIPLLPDKCYVTTQCFYVYLLCSSQQESSRIQTGVSLELMDITLCY